MSAARARMPTKAAVARAVAAARGAGIDARAVRLFPDGSVMVLPLEAVEPKPPAGVADTWADLN